MDDKAYVGIVNKDGSVDSVHCKYGLNKYTIDCLLEHYRDARKVRKLISLGSLVSIGDMVDLPKGCSCYADIDPILYVTKAMHRDCGADDIVISHYSDVDEFRKAKNDDHDFAFLYNRGKWFVVDCRDVWKYDKDFNKFRDDSRSVVPLTQDNVSKMFKNEVDWMDS